MSAPAAQGARADGAGERAQRDRRPVASERAATAVAAAAALAVLVPLLYVAAGPLLTDDLWFHLGAGRAYARLGPWPAADPMLHTALREAPVQHEWLFGVAVHALERAFGLHGLRAAHALAVAGLAAALALRLRRAAPTGAAAALAAAVFLALAWWRLAQLRPDLASIAAALAAYALVLAGPEPPSRRQVAAFAGLAALWANLHSLFMVGLALVVACLLGLALEAALARAAAADPERARRGARARRLAAALGLGALAALANPRGARQHLQFLHASTATGVLQVRDEWVPFHPLSIRAGGYAENPVAWALTNALALLFLAAAGRALLRFARERSPARLRAFDAEGFGLGLAAFAAILVSIRFRWLAFLPLLYLLRAAGRAPRARAPAASWAAAGAAAALALATLRAGGVERWTGLEPREPRAYLARTHVAGKYHAEGVRFLAEAGIEGKLFNHYWMGGFLGYWLAPGLRTFVDGRAEHYPPEILDEAHAISGRRGARPEERSHLDVLDRRGVDVFFGVGLAPVGAGPGVGVYTADNLAGDPGWILAFRAVDQGVYVREGSANAERAARFYAARGVPFDPRAGLDPDRVIAEAPVFAAAWRLLPRDHEALRRAAAAGRAPARAAAGATLACAYAAGGAFRSAADAARGALAADPASRPARRALVYALLRLERWDEAVEGARALLALDPADPAARRVARIARGAQETRGAALATRLLRFPLLDHAEMRALLARYESASLRRRAASGAIEVVAHAGGGERAARAARREGRGAAPRSPILAGSWGSPAGSRGSP